MFSWPLYCHPRIELAGRFPFEPARLQPFYLSPTVAIHQHFYRGTVTIGRRKFELQPGDITLTPSQTISKYQLHESGHHWCVHFHPEAKGTTPITLPLHLRSNQEGVSDRFRIMVDTARLFDAPKKRALARAAVGAMLQSLLLKLTLENQANQGAERKESRNSDAKMDEIRKRLDEEFRQRIEVGELARSSGLSRNYFTARFRLRFGTSVDHYLLHRRIELARHLLLSSELAVKEVAYECGIHDPQYFNKQFRRVTGFSPSAYRGQMGK